MPRSQDDGTILAWITGITRRYTARGSLTDESRAAAVDELRHLAGDRPDLLAEVAGLSLGLADGGASIVPRQYELQAELCVLAGADSELIERWRPVGAARAFAARQAHRA